MTLLQPAYRVGFERREFTAYGFRLHPLTLGHVQLMAMQDSEIPWQCGSEIAIADICGAIAVGIFPAWEDASHALTTDPKIAMDIGRAMADAPGVEQAAKVVEWLAYYIDKPKSNAAFDVMESRCPWWWTYAEFLQTEMGKSEDQAWGTICADAFCYYAAFAGRQGSKHFLTIREYVIQSQVEQGKTIKQMFDEGGL